MALSSSSLSSSLQSSWLPTDGGSYPGSATESGDAFAGAVSSWFAAATAGPYPCSTATARRSQLAASAGCHEESLHRLLDDTRLNHRVSATGGVLASESAALLRAFFDTRRA